MGFFTPGYIKEGKGVSKEEAQKRSYFGTLLDKFFDLIKINLLYFACNILALILCALIAIPLWSLENVSFALNQIAKFGNVLPAFWMLMPLCPLILTGPFTAGLTYITRNFVKKEHSFLMSDFFEHSKKNIKQTLIVNIIFFSVFCLYVLVFLFYFMRVQNSILIAVIAVFGAVLMIVPFYVYPMLISFDLKVKDIFKNAWIFSLAKLPQNLVFLLFVGAVHIASIYFYGIWLAFVPIILLSWSSYTMNHYTWHVISKYMMPEEEKQEPIFSDELKDK